MTCRCGWLLSTPTLPSPGPTCGAKLPSRTSPAPQIVGNVYQGLLWAARARALLAVGLQIQGVGDNTGRILTPWTKSEATRHGGERRCELMCAACTDHRLGCLVAWRRKREGSLLRPEHGEQEHMGERHPHSQAKCLLTSPPLPSGFNETRAMHTLRSPANSIGALARLSIGAHEERKYSHHMVKTTARRKTTSQTGRTW
jgi:hypothetical protein